jgi:hypothetical protein
MCIVKDSTTDGKNSKVLKTGGRKSLKINGSLK